MSRDEIMYLQDIAESCEKILRFTAGLSQSDLIGDEKTYDAVVRNLEIVGEAAKHISEEIGRQLPDIEWRKAAGLRDMLAHAYFGIDDDILWDVVQNKVPRLANATRAFLNKNMA
ncbi:MAG TPA: DUF86 domain-containing protein [Sedimentisphaerales bacterium]|nr:DUF86 domain-containing protein [Sedimentisphaerales bacterium]